MKDEFTIDQLQFMQNMAGTVAGNRVYLPESFRQRKSPVFEPNEVSIIKEWDYWDGCLSGVCKIEGQYFFFDHMIESVWHHFEFSAPDNGPERLWRVYAVYDCTITHAYAQKGKDHKKGEPDYGEHIGIFW